MGANPLPAAPRVAELVTMLVGKKVRVVTTPPLTAASARGLATYVDETGKLTFLAVSDMAFLAGVGAALAMIPPAVVAEAVKSGKAEGVLLENAFEVMNIASSLFNDPEGKGTHVKIQELVVAPPLPPELAAHLAKPAARVDLQVELPGYPSGKLSLLAVTR